MKLFGKKKTTSPLRRHASRRAAAQEQTRATQQDLEQRYAFRRNRTLTGSLSSEVSSANIERMELRSPRVQRHDLLAHRRKLGSVLLVVAFCVAGSGWLLYQSIATVKIVSSAATRPIDSPLYQQKVESYLNNNLTERLRATLSPESLSEYLQKNGAPEVSRVASRVDSIGLGTCQIEVIMRRPVVVWRSGTRTYYVDEQGAAFERNYYAEPSVEIVDQSGIAATTSNQVLASNRFLGFIGKVIGRMRAQGYTVTTVVLPAGTSRQIQVSLAEVGYPVTFSIDRSVGEQSEDAARSITYLASKAITPQYIDVRVSGKAYYK